MDYNRNQLSFQVDGQTIEMSLKNMHLAQQITQFEMEGVEMEEYHIENRKIQGLKKHQDYIDLKTLNYVVFKFKKKAIRGVTGIDLYVFTDTITGPILCAVSLDGKSWKKAGILRGTQRYLDFSSEIGPDERYTYLKIQPIGAQPHSTKLFQVAIFKPHQGLFGITSKINRGKIYTNSNTVYLQITDFRVFDGDRISIQINGQHIAKKKLLTRRSRFIKIPLEKPVTEIVITALNEGYKPPNTLDLKLVDGITIHIGTYRLKKGRRKRIVILKS